MGESLCPGRRSQPTHAVPNWRTGKRAGLKNRWRGPQIGLQGSVQAGISFVNRVTLAPQAGEVRCGRHRVWATCGQDQVACSSRRTVQEAPQRHGTSTNRRHGLPQSYVRIGSSADEEDGEGSEPNPLAQGLRPLVRVLSCGVDSEESSEHPGSWTVG